MAKVSEIIAYLNEVCQQTKKDDPEIGIRELKRALEWPDLLIRARPCHDDDDPDCYYE